MKQKRQHEELQELEQITPEQAKNYKLLGTAFGDSIHQCIFEGLMHRMDFRIKAKYFVVRVLMASEDGKQKLPTGSTKFMVVDFYEEDENP